MGRGSEGAVYLNEVLRSDPQNGPANLGLARIAASSGRKANALMYYHRAIEAAWQNDPEENPLKIRFELADYLAKGGDKTQAIAELLAALADAPDAPVKKRIASLLLEFGSARQSADTFHAVLNADPKDRDALAGLGAAELAQENYVGARNAFQNALRLDPSDEAARKGLELSRRVLELDLNAQGIRAPERYARAKELLEGAATMLNQCLATVKDDPDLAADRELVNSASKAVAQHLRRGLDDAAEDDLTLALQVWRARQKLCGSEAAGDEAMRRILNRIARE